MNYLIIFLLSFFSFKTEKTTITVAADGSGDFTSIQAAVESVKDSVAARSTVIFIKKGTYREKVFLSKSGLILRGEVAPKLGGQWTDGGVKIVYSISREMFRCDNPDDWGAATLNIRASDITLENLIVVNDFGFTAQGDSTFMCKGVAKVTHKDGHQFALRCMPPCQRLTFKNCNFHSWGGDTVSPWDVDNGSFLFQNCTMEGAVDFYCPRGWAYAENCYFICHNLNAAIWHDGTANETAKTVIKNSQFVGDKGYKLGRFHRDAQFFLINCQFSKDMADDDIYQVRKDTTLRWGKRVNYFNCHREGGDFAWHKDNITKELAEKIDLDWTLKPYWDMPIQKIRAEYALPPVANASTKIDNSGNSKTNEIADKMLIAQRKNGGWSKTIDGKTQPPQYDKVWTDAFTATVKDEIGRNDATIDNGATNREIQYLAKIYNETQNEKYKVAAEQGIAYLLKMQYKNGGFPQFFPDTSGYRKHITFNDDAMVNVLKTLKAIADAKVPFEKVGEKYRKEAQHAVDLGIDVILKTQIVSKGRLTIWCAQHDYKTLKPTKARAFELVSLSGKESVGIIEFLMSLNNPTPSVKRAIQAGVQFLDSIKIVGYNVKDIEDATQPKGKDRVLVKDETSVIWARFYDLDTHKPFFCGRDGIKKDKMTDIEHERRTGYAWYVNDGRSLIEKKYPKWQEKWGK
ncbi:MAG: pectate lyase [Saprospiraceae bacterium]|nr:pectate lyase [Saprospiraceae bacterium]